MTEVLHAPAKLTFSLRVTGICDRDPFRGFHLIDAVMTTLDLHDVLHITELPPGSESRVEYVGRFSAGLDGTSGTDLVSRALQVAGRSAEVIVTKNIPHGGGLGGGSADAAAILRWAGVTDLDLAARIGADVAFCLSGHGRARVRGIGEIVEAIPGDPGNVTLVVPPFSVSTPAVYRAWDELNVPGSTAPQSDVDQHVDDPVNDLERAALVVEPELVEWKSRITREVGHPPTLAGSGATWFVIGDHDSISPRLPEATVVVTNYQ